MFNQILLLEDNILDQKRIIQELKDLHSKIHLSTSLSDARKVLEKEEVDLIISDIILDDGMGLSLLNVSTIPKIFITASTNIDLVIEAINNGASDYLIKDVESTYLKVLRTRIQKLFNEVQRQKEFLFLEKTYKDIVDNSSDFIFLVDGVDNCFIFMNRSMKYELTGKNEIDLSELKLKDYFPKHHTCFKELTSKRKLGELISNVSLMTKNFKEENIILEGNILVTQDLNRETVFRGIFKNMTQRRKLEEEIKKLLKDGKD